MDVQLHPIQYYIHSMVQLLVHVQISLIHFSKGGKEE